MIFEEFPTNRNFEREVKRMKTFSSRHNFSCQVIQLLIMCKTFCVFKSTHIVMLHNKPTQILYNLSKAVQSYTLSFSGCVCLYVSKMCVCVLVSMWSLFQCSRLQGSEIKQDCQISSVHMQRHAWLHKSERRNLWPQPDTIPPNHSHKLQSILPCLSNGLLPLSLPAALICYISNCLL